MPSSFNISRFGPNDRTLPRVNFAFYDSLYRNLPYRAADTCFHTLRRTIFKARFEQFGNLWVNGHPLPTAPKALL